MQNLLTMGELTQAQVHKLPQEMLMKIFSLLSLTDLYNVLLVCRKWRLVAESPWLWRRMEIVVGQMKVS